MKEFIEKLNKRLKEKLLEYINKANDEMIVNGHTLDFENFLGHKEAYENVLYEIVNELAEEYKLFGNSEQVKQTNAGRIRSMTDEELAEFLEQFEVCSHCEYSDKERCTFENPCVHEFATAMALKWLQSEAE